MRRLDLGWVSNCLATTTTSWASTALEELVEELVAARRVIGYAALSKMYLAEDGYHDLVRELSAYEGSFPETEEAH